MNVNDVASMVSSNLIRKSEIPVAQRTGSVDAGTFDGHANKRPAPVREDTVELSPAARERMAAMKAERIANARADEAAAVPSVNVASQRIAPVDAANVEAKTTALQAVDAFWAELNANGDDYISEDEFNSWLQNLAGGAQNSAQFDALKQNAQSLWNEAISGISQAGLAEDGQPANSVSVSQYNMWKQVKGLV